MCYILECFTTDCSATEKLHVKSMCGRRMRTNRTPTTSIHLGKHGVENIVYHFDGLQIARLFNRSKLCIGTNLNIYFSLLFI